MRRDPRRRGRARLDQSLAGRVLVAALLFAACSKSPTQLLVIVDSDLQVPSELAAVRAVLRDEGGVEKKAHRFVLGADGVALPISFGAGPGEAASSRVMIDLEAIAPNDSVLFTRRVITSFVEGKSLVLPVFLAARCNVDRCDAAQTCGENGCISPEIDPGTLCEDGTDVCAGPMPGDAGVIGEDVPAPDVPESPDVPPGDVPINDDVGPEDVPVAPDVDIDSGVAPDAELDGGVDAGPPAPRNVVLPSLSGDPIESRPVIADPGQWMYTGRLSYALQWQVCDLAGICSDLQGATSNIYVPSRSMVDLRLQVIVTVTDDVGSAFAVTAISAPIRRATPTNPTFFTGFEAGLTQGSGEAGDVFNPGATVTTANIRSGNYALRTESFSPMGQVTGFVKNVSPSPVLVTRFVFALSGLMQAQGVLIARIAGSQPVYLGYNPATQQIALIAGNNPNPIYGPVIPTQQWVMVDLRYQDMMGAIAVSWRVNAIEQTPVNFPGGFGGGVTAIGFGENNTPGLVVDFDDLTISATGDDFPLGDVSIVGLKPNASGNHNAPQGAFFDSNNQPILQGENASWQLIDDWAPNDNPNDYVRVENSFPGFGHLEYQLEDVGDAPSSLRLVAAISAPPNEIAAASLVVAFPNGLTHQFEAQQTDTTMGGRWFFSRLIPRDPNGMVWTVNDVNGAVVRFSSSPMANGRPWLEAVFLEAELPR